MEPRRATFQAIGTQWEIRINEEVADSSWQKLLRQIHGRIAAFDKAYSRFRSDSLVSQMAEKAGTYKLPEDGFELLQFYERLYEATGGKVTPLIGQVMVDAGYDANYSFESKPLRRPQPWEDILSYDEEQITLKQPALLDFGAAGKGYLVDIIGELVENADLWDYLINAGGDILHRSTGKEKIEVGLENPLDTTEAVGIAYISNQSLCASAGSKRAWGEFHHIIDPTILHSPNLVVASWVIAEDTMTADGLATALFLKDSPALSNEFTFSYAVLLKDMSLCYSKDFPVTPFEADR